MTHCWYCSKTRKKRGNVDRSTNRILTWDPVGNVWALIVLSEESGVCEDERWARESRSDVDLVDRADDESDGSATASKQCINASSISCGWEDCLYLNQRWLRQKHSEVVVLKKDDDRTAKQSSRTMHLPLLKVGISEASTKGQDGCSRLSMHFQISRQLPDWWLFEAKSEAEIDCNGRDVVCIDVCGATAAITGGCSSGASSRWICNMYESAARQKIAFLTLFKTTMKYLLERQSRRSLNFRYRLWVIALFLVHLDKQFPGTRDLYNRPSSRKSWKRRLEFLFLSYLIIPSFSIAISSTPNIHSGIHSDSTMTSTCPWNTFIETFLSKQFPAIRF